MDTKIIETDFEKAKNWEGVHYLANDILLIDNLAEALFPSEPRRMNFILLGMCTRGSVKYRMDTQEQILRPGDVLVVSDRRVIDNYSASKDLEGMCMLISVPFYQEIIRNVSDVSALFLFSRTHPVIAFNDHERQVFSEYFLLIKEKIGELGNHYRTDLVRTLMLAMFYDLSNVIYRSHNQENQHQTRADIIFTKFIKSVEENCSKHRLVSWYAKQLCITPKYLSEMVKHVSKRTPNEWIDDYVLRETRVMLKNSTMSIKEIARQLNFPNQSFFGKYFKEHIGMSPSKYRNS